MRLTQIYDQEYVKPTPIKGDVIEIELNDDTVVETTIAGVDADGNVLIYLDETAINMIEQRGMLAESVQYNESGYDENPVVNAITRRIMLQGTDLLSKYGPEKVMAAIEDVADFVGDVEEIGSSDVSAWVKQVERSLHDHHGVEEDAPFLAKAAGGLALGALGAAGAPAIVGLLGPIFGTALAAYGAYNSAKGGMWAADKLWDMATKKLGDDGAEQFAQDHIRAAAKHLDKFDFNGKEYPVTLKPDQVKPAIQAVKAVAESLIEAKYHGKEVTLGKPVRGGPKKFYVYVRDPSTKNIKKVNFGDPNMRIKKSSPKHRKSFRARHHCSNPGPRTKARYWSCRKW